jgi:hypothetical protein
VPDRQVRKAAHGRDHDSWASRSEVVLIESEVATESGAKKEAA